MRVRCLSSLTSDIVKPYSDSFRSDDGASAHRFNLSPGRDYTVYALGLTMHGIWIYVADDAYVDGPRRYPLCLFELVNPAASRHWMLTTGRKDGEDPDLLAPAEWLEIDWFFNRVVDGDAHAVAAFSKIKRDLDAEEVASTSRED